MKASKQLPCGSVYNTSLIHRAETNGLVELSFTVSQILPRDADTDRTESRRHTKLETQGYAVVRFANKFGISNSSMTWQLRRCRIERYKPPYPACEASQGLLSRLSSSHSLKLRLNSIHNLTYTNLTRFSRYRRYPVLNHSKEIFTSRNVSNTPVSMLVDQNGRGKLDIGLQLNKTHTNQSLKVK